jgi:hypothetical protein
MADGSLSMMSGHAHLIRNGRLQRAASESQVRQHIFDHLYMLVLFIFQLFEQFPYHFDLTLLCEPSVELTRLALLGQCGVQDLIWSAQTSVVAHVIPPFGFLSVRKFVFPHIFTISLMSSLSLPPACRQAGVDETGLVEVLKAISGTKHWYASHYQNNVISNQGHLKMNVSDGPGVYPYHLWLSIYPIPKP